MTKQREAFRPRVPGKVGMYVCGVTTYDLSHIGHARAYVTFDVLYRYLRHIGFDVCYVRNFTDVDDKIIVRAQELGEDPISLSSRFCDEFHADVVQLQCLPPSYEPKVSEHIEQIVDMIKEAIFKNFDQLHVLGVCLSVMPSINLLSFKGFNSSAVHPSLYEVKISGPFPPSRCGNSIKNVRFLDRKFSENLEKRIRDRVQCVNYKEESIVEEEDEEICPVDCVREFKTEEEFSMFLEKSKKSESLLVVDFYRNSCGSCKYIEKGFIKLCKGSGDQKAHIIFLKHNVMDEYDEQTEVAERLRIRSVPLFQFYKDGVLVEAFPTRDKERIITAIQKYTSVEI